MSQYITLLLPLLTLAAGALLQHQLSKSSRKSEETILRQQQAYVDYLSASVGAKFSRSNSAKDDQANLIDAKLRIAVYGSREVIAKLAEFERIGARLNNQTSIKRYLELVSEMRNAATTFVGRNSSTDLEVVLFGSEN